MLKKTVLAVSFVLLTAALWASGRSDDAPDDVVIEPVKTKENKPESLLDLAEKGDVAGIESMLKVDIDLDESDSDGLTALHVAARSGETAIVETLIRRGATVDAPDSGGRTALLLAVRNGHGGPAAALVAAGADISRADAAELSPAEALLSAPTSLVPSVVTPANVDSPSVDGEPLLHAAASRGLTGHVAALLDAGADPSAKDAMGRTAVDAALAGNVGTKQCESAAVLLKRGSPAPASPEWRYIAEPLRTGNTELRFDYGSTALHLAAERGQEGMVRYLLEIGAAIGARDQPGNTALHIAVRRGYRTIASLLLDRGSDVNVRDYNGNTPIHESLTASDDYAIMRMLLDRGADPNAKNGSGSTPLHLAVSLEADVAAERTLLDRGALVDPRDRTGNTPLLLAVESGDREAAELFLSEGAAIHSRNNKGLTPAVSALTAGKETSGWFFTGSRLLETDNDGLSILHIGVAMGVDSETLEVLLKAGALPDLRDFNGETALHYAVSSLRMDLASALMDYGADPFLENNAGMTPLILAFDHGPDTAVAFLAGRIDTTDAWGGTPLFHAVRWEYPVIVAALLEAGADAGHRNNYGGTALHEAVKSGTLECAKLLLDGSADPDAADDLGRTPLHDAVTWGAFEMARLLAAKGADTDARDGSGQTALHMAAFAGNDDIAAWLLSAGADPDVGDNDGRSPLFIAAESDRIGTATLLLRSGADLNLRDNQGRTALHAALAMGRTGVAAFFIDSGSDIFARDAHGRSPFDLAMDGGPSVMAALMTPGLARRQDNDGNTPLHLAVLAGADADVIDVILDGGAVRSARNAKGKTAADLARESGDETLASLLR